MKLYLTIFFIVSMMAGNWQLMIAMQENSSASSDCSSIDSNDDNQKVPFDSLFDDYCDENDEALMITLLREQKQPPLVIQYVRYFGVILLLRYMACKEYCLDKWENFKEYASKWKDLKNYIFFIKVF